MPRVAVQAPDLGRERARQRLPRPEPHVIVLFGATGDLARRKLLPGLFHLGKAGLLPEEYRVVGTSLDDLSEGEFRDRVAREALREFCRIVLGDDEWTAFRERLTYVPSRADALAEAVAKAEQSMGQ